ncbi:MAG TPA: hypothetical protein VI112_18070 [Bacteroidia bacterium]|jgi:hypothetical protein
MKKAFISLAILFCALPVFSQKKGWKTLPAFEFRLGRLAGAMVLYADSTYYFYFDSEVDEGLLENYKYLDTGTFSLKGKKLVFRSAKVPVTKEEHYFHNDRVSLKFNRDGDIKRVRFRTTSNIRHGRRKRFCFRVDDF